MAQSGLGNLLKYLKRRSLRQAHGLPDSALLERYVQSRDEAAFELLVWRHGALVLNTCRRLLRNHHDIDDAFQATFATLACKARGIRGQNSVAPWLYKVAYRAALSARTRSCRHLTLPRELEPSAAGEDELLWRDLRETLDGEVHRLPTKYRDAFVLCYLQGLTHGEAAARLGCPEGTIHSRLATAKERLRDRLERRGVTLSSTGMALEFATRHATVAPGVELIQKTLTTVCAIHGSGLAGATASSSAIKLTRGVLLTMWMQTFAAPALVAVAIGVTGIGIGSMSWQTKNAEPAQSKAADAKVAGQPTRPKPAEPKPDDQSQLAEARRAKEVGQALDQLDKAIAESFAEEKDIRAMLEKSREQVTRRIFEEEVALRDIEATINPGLQRAKKMLGALEEEEIRLTIALHANDKALGDNHIENQKKADQLKHLEKLIAEQTARISALESDRIQRASSLQHSLKNQRRRLQSDEENSLRRTAQAQRRLESLENTRQAVRLAAQLPQLEKLMNANASREIDSNRLEAKLDQVLQELSEIKRQLAKP